jgi:hypothetical protein
VKPVKISVRVADKKHNHMYVKTKKNKCSNTVSKMLSNNMFEKTLHGSEVPQIIVSYFNDIFDIRSLSLASKLFYDVFSVKRNYQSIIDRNMEVIVKHYGFANLDSFLSILNKHRMVLSGSAVLGAIGAANKDEILSTGDLDLYIDIQTHPLRKFIYSNKFHIQQQILNNKVIRPIQDYLLHLGYYLVSKSGIYTEMSCFTFKSRDHHKQIQVILCRRELAEEVKHFDFNFLSNIYSATTCEIRFGPNKGKQCLSGKLIAFFPKSVIQKTSYVDVGLPKILRQWGIEKFSRRLDKRKLRIVKYEARGFKIIGLLTVKHLKDI